VEQMNEVIAIEGWKLQEEVMPRLKEEKVANFQKVLQEMSQIEIDNNFKAAAEWSKVMGSRNLSSTANL